jgi:uncharacterized protein Smg (DUF494 family)
MGEETFFEIILFLAERFSETYPQKWELDEVVGFLLQDEPDWHEIVPTPFRRSSKGFRVLSPQEMNRITPEAYGYLIDLKRLGIIDDDSLEDVMENAMEIGEEIIERDDLVQIVNRIIHGIADEDLNKAR